MWQRRAKHCPLCAAALVQGALEGRARVHCSVCSFVLYENPAAASAGLVLDGERRVLLVRRAIEPFRGRWALPAGYQEIDEEPAQTAVREVREESGIEVEVLSLHDLIFVPEDLRRPANVAIYLCRPVGGRLQAGEDALEAAWFGLDALPLDLAFDNGPRILDRLRRSLP
ncbi:MAG: NUDIX domain-containing protein [Planctomycetes bacterium]|nr:NUDIX domain-containing protein [Planctomycetota bacterium]